MTETLSIKRRKSRQSTSSFDSLRHEAIRLIEQISGKQWTDYNLHDPGITILEQLIYGITDLIYRSDFDVEDYLANKDGSIDFDSLALHSPAEAFPCRATTLLDYRKLLLNLVPQADNVWLTPMDSQSAPTGLYRVSVKFAQGLDDSACAEATQQLCAAYRSARNLCEDIGEIKVVKNIEYQLCANIEVSSALRASELLGEIYFACAQQLASSVAVTSYDTLIGQALDFDQLFDGPLTTHGFFRDEDMRSRLGKFQVSNLFNAINAIAGVDHVQQLYLKNDQQDCYDLIESDNEDEAFSLLLPQSADQVKVTLTTNGRKLNIDLHELRAKYDELNFKYQRSRSTPQDLSLLYQPPRGEARRYSEYFSIQNHFPLNYGINAFGIPDSADDDVKARARQLKSYLLVFEQLLANFLGNLDALPELFSLRNGSRKSYAFESLQAAQINDLEALYTKNTEERFDQLIEGFDNYHHRKSRLLDHLLALYGERFSQNSLRHFNYYYSRHEIEEVIVANKITWLKSVIELGRDRAAAPDYGTSSCKEAAHSGIDLRLRLLLGFESENSYSLTMAILAQGFNLCRHQDYEQLKSGSQELKFINIDELDGFETVPPQESSDVSIHSLRELLAESYLLKNNLLSDELLSGGIFIDRYHIGSLPSTQEYQLTFNIDTEQHWYLGSFSKREKAVEAANQLRQFLIQLNRQSEGLHIVEHVLLRPLCSEAEKGSDTDSEDDFYSMQVSVLFPAWTARCRDARFRLLAQETLQLNLPAHVFAQVHWLEFDSMYEFETLFDQWRDLKRDAQAAQSEIDDSAQHIISFLRAQDKQVRTHG